MEKLQAISPIDGRYKNKTEELSEYFSEEALINYRIFVECEYFIFLLEELSKIDKKIKKLNSKEEKIIREIYFNKSKNAFDVKQIEFKGDQNIPPTNHDVKAVEYFLKKKFLNTTFKDRLEFIHFGLTSEDINNIAYSLIIENSLRKVLYPQIEKILNLLKVYSIKYSSHPLLARTHGQPAVGTTFGKEFRIFYERIKKQLDYLKKHQISIKINGAVGNYNALYSAYPEINWILFSKRFVNKLERITSLKFSTNIFTTQIENHDSWVEIFDRLKHLNFILISLCQDIWLYISRDLIIQKSIKGEIGSSTMPHKINPIDFENAEGNLQISNSFLKLFSDKFPISRLQRDLSDSTVERNIGVSFSHSLIAYKSILKGLNKIEINTKEAEKEFLIHPEIYTEAIQTIMRREKIKNSYEILKNISRGKKISKNILMKFINKLKIREKVKDELKNILNMPYIGLAEKLSKEKI